MVLRYADQRMDALKVETPKKRLVGKRSIGAADENQVFLVVVFYFC